MISRISSALVQMSRVFAETKVLTIGMPHSATNEFHGRRAQRVILGKLQFSGEDPTLKGSAFGALDKSFPVEHVVLRHRACGDTLWGVGGEILVFMKKTLLCD